MTMFDVDGLGTFPGGGSGVRLSGEVMRTYDLIAIAADVEGVVAAAGGWLCDRVRAGWQVTVVVPAGSDVRPLTILGVHTEEAGSAADALRRPAAAVAIDAQVLHDDDVRQAVSRLVDTGRVEVTVWGGTSASLGSDGQFDRVRHRLSAAARAFKAGALRTAGQPPTEPVTEDFVSIGLWYPPDGADLVPVEGP